MIFISSSLLDSRIRRNTHTVKQVWPFAPSALECLRGIDAHSFMSICWWLLMDGCIPKHLRRENIFFSANTGHSGRNVRPEWKPKSARQWHFTPSKVGAGNGLKHVIFWRVKLCFPILGHDLICCGFLRCNRQTISKPPLSKNLGALHWNGMTT